MTDQEIKHAQKRAKKWARDNGFEKEADDMSQYVLMQLVNKRKAAVENICIDYLRDNFGRTGPLRRKVSKIKSDEKRGYLQISSQIESDKLSYNLNTQDLDFRILQNKLPPLNRAIVTLFYKWGMTQTQIGDCIGLSPGRVNQRLKETLKLLKQFV